MKRLPLVSIVGKPNCGKSTLFNRIVRSRKAITHATPGVTRDRMEERTSWNGVEFTLIDTGGFASGADDPLQKEITDRIRKTAAESAVILLLVDVDTGPTADDDYLLRELRGEREKMILAVNKVESEADSWSASEFYKLGFDSMYTISALHGSGIGELLDEVVSRLPRRLRPRAADTLKIAIVGKPNVGKSSLVNMLAGEDRHIVSEEPGTTRDSIHLHLLYHGREIVLVDTAGIKRRSKTPKGLGVISALKSLESIAVSDVVLVIVDATGGVSRQDTRIAAEAHKKRKGIAVLINKWDLVEKDEATAGEFVREARRAMPFLSYAPILTISALTGLRIERIIPLCFEIQKARTKRIGTSEINALIKRITEETSPTYYRGGTGKVYYATQTGTEPPTFTLFVNKATYFHRSYIRYMNNRIRKMFTFSGTAIRISLRSKER